MLRHRPQSVSACLQSVAIDRQLCQYVHHECQHANYECQHANYASLHAYGSPEAISAMQSPVAYRVCSSLDMVCGVPLICIRITGTDRDAHALSIRGSWRPPGR